VSVDFAKKKHMTENIASFFMIPEDSVFAVPTSPGILSLCEHGRESGVDIMVVKRGHVCLIASD